MASNKSVDKSIELAVFWGIIKAFFVLATAIPVIAIIIFILIPSIGTSRTLSPEARELKELKDRAQQLNAEVTCKSELPTEATPDQLYDCIQQKISEREH